MRSGLAGSVNCSPSSQAVSLSTFSRNTVITLSQSAINLLFLSCPSFSQKKVNGSPLKYIFYNFILLFFFNIFFRPTGFWAYTMSLEIVILCS